MVTPVLLGFSLVAVLFLWLFHKPQREPPSVQMADQPKVVSPSTSVSSQPPLAQPAEKKIDLSNKQKPEQVAEAKIEKVASLNLKGHKLIKQGRYREAVPVLNQAVETVPENTTAIDYVFAQYNLAHSLRKLGRSDEAIPYLERCLAYDRHNVMFQRELQAARRDLARDNY